MTTPEEYRRYADECMKWAREAKSDKDRETFLELASAWLQAAAIGDGNPPIARSDPQQPKATH